MSIWTQKLNEYRTAVEAAKIVMSSMDTTGSSPGKREKELLSGIAVMCEVAATRIDEANAEWDKAQKATAEIND